MKNRSGKTASLFHACLFALVMASASLPAAADVPDSAYVKAYDSGNRLRFCWSNDGAEWRDAWNNHGFLQCDYGPWGSGKRMTNVRLTRDPSGTWHCLWYADDKTIAHASSPDLVTWGRQSYHPREREESLVAALDLRDGEQPNVFRVAWDVVDHIETTARLAAYNNRLWNEQAKDDPTRFAGLREVEARLSLRAGETRPVSDMLIGVFFEDISHAADGGLYAELVRNRDFEYDPAEKGGRDRNWHHGTAWTTRGVIDTVAPLHPNNKHYIALLADGKSGLTNNGYDGIAVKAGESYNLSLFARVAGKMPVDAFLVDSENGDTVARARVNVPASKGWKKHKTTLVARKTAPKCMLVIVPRGNGRVDLDMISLFPRNTFKRRENGLRDDLARAIADLKPRFVRFPGGCVAHGDGLDNMYRWKTTIGPLEARVPQRNIWGYHQSVGLGYLEYFQFCEDIGAEPLPIVPAGVPCQNSGTGGPGQQGGIPLEEMEEYVQEVLDLVEWANGDKHTPWGKKRVEAGHPAPFNLKYIGVGNEDLISDVFEERFAMIFEAVKRKYPEITVIGTVGPFSEGTDYCEGWDVASKLGVPVVDEHYYQPPAWFIYNQDFYDKYDRSKSKVYLGEYAAHLPGRPNNVETALAEALHLTTLERNGDVVIMSSYAPLLAREGRVNWNPDLIYFNNEEVKLTVGYHVQKLFSENAGDEYLANDLHVGNDREEVKRRIACSVTRSKKTGDVFVKLVNLLPVNVNMELPDAGTSGSAATRTVLTGRPDDRGARPVTGSVDTSALSRVVLPPYSLTIFRINP
ncbi:MAG: alpha-L-arabinofuranosidase [Odoribacteraceae bacterium]|nr:alpha-L-arabinofuranosidase [Odoribacteraceae bacterium]